MADEKKRDFTIELGDRQPNGHFEAAPRPVVPKMAAPAAIVNNPLFSILAYCGSSILMTVSNKYCVNGTGWNLSFFLLAVQVCSRYELEIAGICEG